MKVFQAALVAVLLATFSLKGNAEVNPMLKDVSPELVPILQHVMDRAKLEDQNDRSFKQLYSFSREKINNTYNGDGGLLKREVKDSTHQPKATDIDVPVQPKPTTTVGAPKNQHPALQGQTFDKNELLNEDTIKRFDFTLVNQEMLNGRNMYVIDFAPKKTTLPEGSLKERFLNKATGRVWVDAADYTIVKAALHLMKPVDVGLGLFSVKKFTYTFERNRTDDGYWFTQMSNWHLEDREGIFNRVRDHTESISNLSKIGATATR